MGNRHVPRDIKKMEKAAYKSEKTEVKEERKALVVESNAKAGQHNCPLKDAGTTHAFRARCLTKQHGGFCPACGLTFGYQYGCKEHGFKQDALLDKGPSEEELKQFRIDHGLESEPTTDEEDEAEPEAPSRRKKGKGKGRRR